MNKKLHWWATSWLWISEDGGTCYGDTTSGFSRKDLTLSCFSAIKRINKIPDEAVRLSVTYLGRMTSGYFRDTQIIEEMK